MEIPTFNKRRVAELGGEKQKEKHLWTIGEDPGAQCPAKHNHRAEEIASDIDSPKQMPMDNAREQEMLSSLYEVFWRSFI